MLGSFLLFDELNDLVAIMLLLPLGFIPATLYLQGFVIKKWCKVCLIITLLVTMSAVDVFFHYDYRTLFANKSVEDTGLGVIGLALFAGAIISLFVQKVELKESLNFWKGYNNFMWSFPEVPKEINNAFCAPDELPEMYVISSDKKQDNIGVLNILLKPGCKHCIMILEYFKTKSDSYLRMVNINFIISYSKMEKSETNKLINNFQELPSLKGKFHFLHLRLNEEPSTHKKEEEEARTIKRTSYPSIEINGVIVPPFLVGQEAMFDFIQRLEYSAK